MGRPFVVFGTSTKYSGAAEIFQAGLQRLVGDTCGQSTALIFQQLFVLLTDRRALNPHVIHSLSPDWGVPQGLSTELPLLVH